MKNMICIIGMICTFWTSQIGAEITNHFAPPQRGARQTFDLRQGGLLTDRSAVGGSPSSGSEIGSSSGAKSPKLAFLMSLVLPGSGELYAGATKRGIGFLAVEAGSWGAYGSLRKSGKDKEKEFRTFADQHWNKTWYEEWRTSSYTYGDTTHTLPEKSGDTQQYYELIGKYDQFVFGWDDRSSDNIADSTQSVKSERRLRYEDMRNDSNKQLKRASFVLGIVLFNHVVSAIDAAKFAQMHGKTAAMEERLKIRMALMTDEGRQVPILVASKRFK